MKLHKCSILIIASFLTDASNPSPSKRTDSLQVDTLLLGFLCVIPLLKRRTEGLFKKFPGKAVLKHPGKIMVFIHHKKL